MRIQTNVDALNAYRNLGTTNRALSKSLERLSSGFRINRAADDAAGLAISEKMRGQIRGLNQAARNAQDGISLIQTAEGSLNETHAILQRMRELAVQAANDTLTANDRIEIQKEVDQLRDEINRIANTTEFNTKKLLDGSTSALVSSDRLSTKVFMRDGLRVEDQFGQKALGGGNYRLDIVANPGTAQIQKTDIFKVKHETGGVSEIDELSGITSFKTSGAPDANFTVDTVDISTPGFPGFELASEESILDGVEANSEVEYTPVVEGTAANHITIQHIDPGANDQALSVEVVDLTNIIVNLATDGAGAITSTANDVIAAVNAHAVASTLVVAGDGAGDGSATAGTGFAALGTTQAAYDTIHAKAHVNAEYQQDNSEGHGLVVALDLVHANTNYNSSILFEVTDIDPDNDTVTVTANYHQYDAKGNHTSGTQTEMTLNAGRVAQNANVIIGNIAFDAESFLLADTNHFTTGDKFSVDVRGSEGLTMDKLNIRNDHGQSREFTFLKGAFNEKETTLRSYYLDADTGQVYNARFDVEFRSEAFDFTERPAIENRDLGATNITRVEGDDLQAATNFQVALIAGNELDPAADVDAAHAVERSYSQTGNAEFTAGVISDAVVDNASLLFEVMRIDGDEIEFRILGHQTNLTGEYTALDYNVILTANQANNIQFNLMDPPDAQFDGEVNYILGDAADFMVGDKFTSFVKGTVTGDAAHRHMQVDSYQRDVSDPSDPFGGVEIDGTRITRTYGYAADLDGDPHTLIHGTFELNEEDGKVHSSKLIFNIDDGGGNGVLGAHDTQATFQTTAKNAVSYTAGEQIGDIASLATKLYDIDRFWDASGNFLLEDPQTITLVQGDGTKAAFTIFRDDTIGDVVAKIDNAIRNEKTNFTPGTVEAGKGLGQGEFVTSGVFAEYITDPADDGYGTVEGTILINSAIAGKFGEIKFVGDENVIKALSLTTIRDAEENRFDVTVVDAHTGDSKDTQTITSNILVGVVHTNVDVEFDPNANVAVDWDNSTNSFNLVKADGKFETYVHLADNTMVYHIGANPLQDVGAAIGDMTARALGVHNTLVIDRDAANSSIRTIDRAIDRVSAERSKLGALQNRLEHTISNLAVASENLSAAESRIRDVDMAAEMMEFTKNQILAQAGTAMLAQANMKPQMVLQLLG